MSTTEPIRNKSELRAIAQHFLLRGEFRNHAMIVLGAHTALRISDLLHLRWDDLYDFQHGRFKKRFTLTEKKTKKRKTVTLHPKAIEALKIWFQYRKSDFIFSNGRKKDAPISRIQAWRVIRKACEQLHISGTIACHSLRKTFGYHAAVGKEVPPTLLMEIYNHISFEVTKRYLGIGQDELDEAYLGVDLF